ncbi:MAG: hypothetical protein KJ018_17605 [Burkholderiales bacterium]|nr:hypothetical protein [Burkholderiales bacterium]
MDASLGPALAALLLAGVYAAGAGAGRETREAAPGHGKRAIASAAAGVSIAYVFVDLLPELAEQNRALRAAAGEPLLFAEQRIYVLALLSFTVMYGIEHIVLGRRDARSEAVASGRRDAVYWIHLAGFAAYSALIGYLLVEREDRGPDALAVYALAMAVHFLVVNHSLAEEHGAMYRTHGRFVLAASVAAGWLLGTVAQLAPGAFARLFAVLAGGVVITSLRSELPDGRRGRFWPFCLAAAAFAVLLMVA